MHRFKRAEEEGQLFTSARYNFEENDVNCKRSLVAAQRLVAQEHLFRNIFFLSFCIFGLHIIGCGSEAKYNLTVTTCQKCLKTGHSTSSLYKMKTYFFLDNECYYIRIRIEYSFTEENISHHFEGSNNFQWSSFMKTYWHCKSGTNGLCK